MPRKSLSVPSYRRHKSSGQAVAVIRLADGRRVSRYLGRHGTAESRAAYAKLIAELAAAPTPTAAIAAKPAAPIPPAALLLAYDQWAERHYRRPDCTPKGELSNVRAAIRVIREGYELQPAAEFGPLALEAVRQRMIDAGLSRGVINQRVARLRHVFKWAVAKQLDPVEVYQSLKCVDGLQRGRTEARETEPVGPVDDVVVDATLPPSRPPRPRPGRGPAADRLSAG
jgi:hypothetical protein